MGETRRYEQATQVIHRREPGAIGSSVAVSLSLSVVLLLLWSAALLLGWASAGTWRTALAVAIFVAALPFVMLAWGKTRFLRGKLEEDLYRVTRWKVDLDQDGNIGDAEASDDDAIASLPEREIIRLVRVNAPQPSRDETVLRLPDERELEASKVRDFVIGAGTIGMGLVAWRGRGWTRPEWETARDLLAMHDLATPRMDGQAGKLLAGPGQCLRAFGL
jgi:hypothetical protein